MLSHMHIHSKYSYSKDLNFLDLEVVIITSHTEKEHVQSSFQLTLRIPNPFY